MRLHPILAALAALALAHPFTAARANPSVVVDVDTGQVLEANEATRPWIPASTTKMMTVYLALKAVKDGKARLDSPLQVSALAARQRPVKMYLKPGQLITLDNALKIMLVKSANDLAYVIAEGIGGSVENFAAMMNDEARQLGMVNSHFVNPNGWDAPGHQSSARDLAILARALLRDFPQYQSYFGIGAVELGNKVIKNTNGLIGRYPGAIGMKTGFVCASGFNLVGVAERGGKRLIAVVLGASSGAERTVEAAHLLDAGFASHENLGTLEMLPASGETSAPNICTSLHHRGVLLSDDSEADAGGAQQEAGQDDNPAYVTLLRRAASGHQPMTMRNARGRVVLVPRAAFDPMPVYLGPKPGSDAPVLMAHSMAPKMTPPPLPGSAMALAGAQSALPGKTPGAAGQVTLPKQGAAGPADATDQVGAPLTLAAPGVKHRAARTASAKAAHHSKVAARKQASSPVAAEKAPAKAAKKSVKKVSAKAAHKAKHEDKAKAAPKGKHKPKIKPKGKAKVKSGAESDN